MPDYLTRDRLAVLAALAAPLGLAAILVPFRTSFPNTDAALAMLLVVVAVAANGYRLAGYLAAVSTAVWFDFFLTQPYERFSITHRTDIETTVLLLVIGVAVTEIAVWGRRQHVTASRRAGYLEGINSAAQAVAAGGSASALIEQVTGQLIDVAFAAIVQLPVRRRRDRPARADAARRFGHRGTTGMGCRRRRFPRHRHRTAGGKRRPLPGPVPDDPGPRRTALTGTAAAGGRVRRPGRRRAGHEPPGRPGLTGNFC